MSDTNERDEKPSFRIKVSSLTADGEWMFQKGEYKKAVSSFTEALALNPCERKCYVGRAKCYMKIHQFEDALKDAEASLDSDKSFYEGLYLKAEALYYMGKFEFALVFYHRGYKIRPHVQGFRLGVQKAQEAIENFVGSPSVRLEILEELSFPTKDKEVRSLAAALIQKLTKEEKRQNPLTPVDEKTTKQLLGEFYEDKKFFEDLMKDEDLVKCVTKSGEKLQDIIQSALTSLNTYAVIQSQEKPRSHPGGYQQKSRTPSKLTQFQKHLHDIHAELTSGNLDAGLRKAEELLRIVHKWSKREVPNKDKLLGNLHSCIRKAFCLLADVDEALERHQTDLQLAKRCKRPDAVSRALDDIGQTYAEHGQFEEAIECWEERIPLVPDALEKTWILHDVGVCYLKLKRYEEARDYGVRSAVAADEVLDAKWQLNGNVLAAEAELKLGEFESSVWHFEKALSLAKLQEDDVVLSAIQKALDGAKRRLSD